MKVARWGKTKGEVCSGLRILAVVSELAYFTFLRSVQAKCGSKQNFQEFLVLGRCDVAS